jgi:hypothetical protein
MWFYVLQYLQFFLELFMCKVLRLGFFYYKLMIYFFIFFGLGPELETNQASQPLAPLCPSNLARKDKELMKVGSKWKWKVGISIIAYCAKWMLTKHSKEVHGLVAEKAKPRRPSTSEGGPTYNNYMERCILMSIPWINYVI